MSNFHYKLNFTIDYFLRENVQFSLLLEITKVVVHSINIDERYRREPMRLDIKGIAPIGEEIFVSFLGETKVIDSSDTHVSFDVLKHSKNTQELVIYNKATKSNYTFWYIILYLFTFPFHILRLLIRVGFEK